MGMTGGYGSGAHGAVPRPAGGVRGRSVEPCRDQCVPWRTMPTRIEIELTSSSPDGSWTWRAAGAREPRGVLDGSILPGGVAVGDQLRVETEHDVDGIRVLSVVPPKEKAARTDMLELLPAEEAFDPVVQQRARGGRPDDRGPRRPRRDRPDRDESGDRRRVDRGGPPRPVRADGSAIVVTGPTASARGGPTVLPRSVAASRAGPHFTPPPELPQRPKPKRLRPGKQHRTDVLTSLPDEQRPVAELALQGIAAVRQRVREDNARLKAAGKPEMPEAGVLRMAEELIPRLRVADWLDRAEAAQRQLEHLDLRDLRSVVASADDPVVARDESTRALAAELKSALATKQEEELALWLTDVEAALDVGRVVRALRLSSVPPKAGVPFPGALATRLGEATTAALQSTDGPDRWSAVLEAAAFSPVRTLVAPRRAGGAAIGRADGDRTALGSAAPAGRRVVRRRGRGRCGGAQTVAPDVAPQGAEPAARRPGPPAEPPPAARATGAPSRRRRRSRPPAPTANRREGAADGSGAPTTAAASRADATSGAAPSRRSRPAAAAVEPPVAPAEAAGSETPESPPEAPRLLRRAVDRRRGAAESIRRAGRRG